LQGTSLNAAVTRLSSQFSKEGKTRLLGPLSVVLATKLLIAWIVYLLATRSGAQFHTFWVDEWGISKPEWPLLFHGWDSAWYIRIAKTGYSYPAYAFLPAHPFMIRMAYLLIGDWILSSFIVSFLLGVAAVPMFQLLAENYMSKDQAAIVTLLFALFPPVFFFTSVAYTESLFLVAIIGTWFFCLRKQWFLSTVLATVATLTKIYGFMIVLPLALRLVREGRKRAAFLAVFVTLTMLLGWGYYLFNVSGDLAAFWSSQNHWREGWPFGIYSVVRAVAESVLNPSGTSYVALSQILIMILWIAVIALAGIPVVKSMEIDEEFGLYGTMLLIFLAAFGNVWSFGRFLPFVLPAWLTVRKARRARLAAAIVMFPMVSLTVWYQFVILGVWVG